MSDSNTIYQQVREHYGSLARAKQPSYSSAIAQAFGYSEEELNSIPAEANLGVSCGNPLAIASLREGETVIDLGSGAGFDVFLASKKVGSSGKAIGVDMNKDMLERARQNQLKSPEARNVSFVEARITSIPLEDGIGDCIISNCVINLVPEDEKPLVFTEMARLLKSGGRVAVSDILARKPLPPGLRESVALYVGCVAGASTQDDYRRWLENAGFKDILIVDAESDLNVYIDMAKAEQKEKRNAAVNSTPLNAESASPHRDAETCCTPGVSAGGTLNDIDGKESQYTLCCQKNIGVEESSTAGDIEYDFSDIDINEWAGSFKIFAIKK